MTPTNLSNNNSNQTPNPMSSTHRTAIVAGCFLLLVIVVAIVYSRHARTAEVNSASAAPGATAPATSMSSMTSPSALFGPAGALRPWSTDTARTLGG